MHILGFHISYDLIPDGNQFPQSSGDLAGVGSAQVVILRGTHLLRHHSEARTEHCANDADQFRAHVGIPIMVRRHASRPGLREGTGGRRSPGRRPARPGHRLDLEPGWPPAQPKKRQR